MKPLNLLYQAFTNRKRKRCTNGIFRLHSMNEAQKMTTRKQL